MLLNGRIQMIGWQTPADDGPTTRTLISVPAMEHGEQIAAMLSEGIAPCHSGEAFRARLEPTDHGTGVCPVCEYEWWLAS